MSHQDTIAIETGRTRAELLARVDAFLRETRMTPRAFGVQAVSDHNFVTKLRGGRGVTLTTIGKAEAFMDGWRARAQAAGDVAEVETDARRAA